MFYHAMIDSAAEISAISEDTFSRLLKLNAEAIKIFPAKVQLHGIGNQ